MLVVKYEYSNESLFPKWAFPRFQMTAGKTGRVGSYAHDRPFNVVVVCFELTWMEIYIRLFMFTTRHLFFPENCNGITPPPPAFFPLSQVPMSMYRYGLACVFGARVGGGCQKTDRTIFHTNHRWRKFVENQLAVGKKIKLQYFRLGRREIQIPESCKFWTVIVSKSTELLVKLWEDSETL